MAAAKRSSDWRGPGRQADHQIRHEDRVPTTTPALQQWFGTLPPSMIVMEAGTHSPWVSRLLEGTGHQVVVADPRRLKLISQSDRKNDRADARTLAQVAAAMPELLHRVRHRSAEAQKDLAVIRSRARLVEVRTKLWLSLRGLSGLCKASLGHRLPRRVTREALREWGDRSEYRPLRQAC